MEIVFEPTNSFHPNPTWRLAYARSSKAFRARRSRTPSSAQSTWYLECNKKHDPTSTICRLLIAWIRPVHFDHALEKNHTRYLQVPSLTGQLWVLLELRKSKIPSLRHCNAIDFQTRLYIRNIFMVLLITHNHNIFLGVGVCQDTMDTIRQTKQLGLRDYMGLYM